MIYIRLLNNEEFLYEGDSIETMQIEKLHRVFSRFSELTGPEAENFSEEDRQNMKAVEYGFDTFNGSQNPYPLKEVTLNNVLYWGPILETALILQIFQSYKSQITTE